MAWRSAVRIELGEVERRELEARTRRRKISRADAMRAEIVLLAADGTTNLAIAEQLGVTRVTVATWRKRFAAKRLDGLADEPRSGAPRKIGDEKIAEVVTTTLETMPVAATHWSTRSMAKASGLSIATVHRIWRAFSLQPHRSETFKLSADPLFVDKVRDIVGLYLNPPDRALVLCVDEKSQIQALDRTQPLLPMRPGQWINQVGRFFALLTDQPIKRGAHRSPAALEAAIAAYIDVRNADPRPFRWTKTADDILASIERFCRRSIAVQAPMWIGISDSGH